jgi:hypothetical protein
MSQEELNKRLHKLNSINMWVPIIPDVQLGTLDTSLKHAILGAQFYSHDPLIHDSNFPTQKPSKPRKVDVIATTFNENVTSDTALEIIASEKLRLLSFYEILEFCYDPRSLHYHLIPCLTSQIRGGYGMNPLCPGLDLMPVIQHFPSKLEHKKVKRVIDVARFGQIWPIGALLPCVSIEE